ncbi:MAG: DUF2147 domain-containing protein [Rhizobiaceae bacterium]
MGKNNLGKVGVALLALSLMTSTSAFADNSIVGNWKTQSGETAGIAKCGNAFCITVKTGQYAGKRIGRMTGKNGSYSGTIVDPSDSKEYSGSAKVSGSNMKLRGCALKIFCKTQNWRKL